MILRTESLFAAGVGEAFADTVTDGPLLVAAVVAATAGLVSFFSPCLLPLVPGYLSYVSGLAGAEVSSNSNKAQSVAGHFGSTLTLTKTKVLSARRRMVAGASLFVLGFTVVFVSYGALFGGLGRALYGHEALIQKVSGVVTIVLGLIFMGAIPSLSREFRLHRLPATGLAGAPVLGVVFGLGWTPCIGPTLGAVQTLALDSASAGRGAFLSVAYCLGMGVPFVAAALGFRWLLGTFALIRRHSVWVMRLGGGMLIMLGLLLLFGWWSDWMIELRAWIASVGGGESPL